MSGLMLSAGLPEGAPTIAASGAEIVSILTSSFTEMSKVCVSAIGAILPVCMTVAAMGIIIKQGYKVYKKFAN